MSIPTSPIWLPSKDSESCERLTFEFGRDVTEVDIRPEGGRCEVGGVGNSVAPRRRENLRGV